MMKQFLAALILATTFTSQAQYTVSTFNSFAPQYSIVSLSSNDVYNIGTANNWGSGGSGGGGGVFVGVTNIYANALTATTNVVGTNTSVLFTLSSNIQFGAMQINRTASPIDYGLGFLTFGNNTTVDNIAFFSSATSSVPIYRNGINGSSYTNTANSVGYSFGGNADLTLWGSGGIGGNLNLTGGGNITLTGGSGGGNISLSGGSSSQPIGVSTTFAGASQWYFQNLDAGNGSSSDIVVGNNLGTSSSTNYYIDMGINSSTYNVNDVGEANDAYIFSAWGSPKMYVFNVQTNGHVRIGAGGNATNMTVIDVSSNSIVLARQVTTTNLIVYGTGQAAITEYGGSLQTNLVTGNFSTRTNGALSLGQSGGTINARISGVDGSSYFTGPETNLSSLVVQGNFIPEGVGPSAVAITASGTNLVGATLSSGLSLISGTLGINITNLTGTLPASAFPILTGDITTAGGALATTMKSTGTAGTYFKTTFDTQGRETSGSNPTTLDGFGIGGATINGTNISGYIGNTGTLGANSGASGQFLGLNAGSIKNWTNIQASDIASGVLSSNLIPALGYVTNNTGIATNLTLWAGTIFQQPTNQPGIEITNAWNNSTTPAPFMDITATWNNASLSSPTAFRLSVTNTSSTGIPLLMDLRNSGTSEFKVSSGGSVTANGNLNVNGNMVGTFAGTGLSIKSGANCKIGQAVLSSGTVTVANTSVTANSQIFLWGITSSGTVGTYFAPTNSISAGTSFVINSITGASVVQTLDTSTVGYMIVEKN